MPAPATSKGVKVMPFRDKQQLSEYQSRYRRENLSKMKLQQAAWRERKKLARRAAAELVAGLPVLVSPADRLISINEVAE